RMRETLDRLARHGTLHPAHGVKMRYANPIDGGYVYPTIAVFIHRQVARPSRCRRRGDRVNQNYCNPCTLFVDHRHFNPSLTVSSPCCPPRAMRRRAGTFRTPLGRASVPPDPPRCKKRILVIAITSRAQTSVLITSSSTRRTVRPL